MNTDIDKEFEDQHERATDRLYSSMQAEWSAMISFNGLLIAAAAISSAMEDTGLSNIPFILVTSSLASTLLVMMNSSAIRKTHQDIYDIHPSIPNSLERAQQMMEQKVVFRRRKWMTRRFTAAKYLMFLSGALTLVTVWK